MGSKCGPALANTFVFTYEKIWLDLYKPSFYARFIDDVLMVVDSLDILNSFKIELDTNYTPKRIKTSRFTSPLLDKYLH
jgi:hypothetical protein